MRSSTTFEILFWVYTQRADKNNLSIIYARITINGKKVIVSLKQKVNVDSSDSKRQRAKCNGKTSRSINYYLDEVKSDLVQNYRDIKTESKILTPQLVKVRYLGVAPIGRHFGKECNVLGEIILSLHELCLQCKIPTYTTTNLNAFELEERYGKGYAAVCGRCLT